MIHYDTHLGLSDLPKTVLQAMDTLEPRLDEFDSIVTEGISGLTIAAPVAVLLNKPLVIVRKSMRDACWHVSEVENARNAGRRCLFFDDHIDLGRTFRHVTVKLREHAPLTRVACTYEAQYDRFRLI